MTLKVLTVGDGDFSFSLALKRAYYPSEIQLLVSTTLLDTEQELIDTYPTSAENNLKELKSSPESCTILYGVDATKLHLNECLVSSQIQHPFDLILFQHPHLGYDSTLCPEQHCQNHQALLYNYFSSAMSLLAMTKGNSPKTSCIHVGLSRGSAERWKVQETARGLHLILAWGSPFAASRPILPPIEERTTNNNQQASKSKGSRRGHWLGRYGYRHQPTFPQDTAFETNVSDSLHYFFALRIDESRVESIG